MNSGGLGSAEEMTRNGNQDEPSKPISRVTCPFRWIAKITGRLGGSIGSPICKTQRKILLGEVVVVLAGE